MPVRLATLRAGTGLKMPDCCVLLAVQESAAKALVTFDERLRTHAVRRGIAVN